MMPKTAATARNVAAITIRPGGIGFSGKKAGSMMVTCTP